MKYFVQGNKGRVGVSAICIGMAVSLHEQGKDASLIRIGSDDAALNDAQTFASINNITAAAEPMSIEQFAQADISNDVISIIEVPQDIDIQNISNNEDRKLFITDEVMEIPAGFDMLIRNHSLKPGPNTIVESSILSSTDLGAILDATDARVISSSSDADRDEIETIMIGPISHDATDSSYFNKFQNKLILTRSEKVDLVLGAMAGDTTCILLTGGNEPSPYIIDRLFGNPETTLAITNYTTNEAMEKIGSIVGVQQINSSKKITEITKLFHEAIDLKDFS
jgi:hypothetical protein